MSFLNKISTSLDKAILGIALAAQIGIAGAGVKVCWSYYGLTQELKQSIKYEQKNRKILLQKQRKILF